MSLTDYSVKVLKAVLKQHEKGKIGTTVGGCRICRIEKHKCDKCKASLICDRFANICNTYGSTTYTNASKDYVIKTLKRAITIVEKREGKQ